MITDDGKIKGNMSFYCRTLNVSREAFYKYLRRKDRPWKYEPLVDKMHSILAEDEYNDMYGRIRMHTALIQKFPEEKIPCESTVNKVMQLAMINNKLRKPHGITKADKNAIPAENLFKRDFQSDKPYKKCVTDITEIPAKDGKIYVSGLFDCYSLQVLGLEIRDNMKADLCVQTIKNAFMTYPQLRGAIVHSDRGSQYTSEVFRSQLNVFGILQSMNSAGGRCHDNARCESMWARMKTELFYKRYDVTELTKEQIKQLVWRYFMSYWNNRRICSSIGNVSPKTKIIEFYNSIKSIA